MTVLEFNFEFQKKPVKINGEDYILQEATSGAAAQYKSACISGTTLKDGKPSTLSGDMAEAEPLLVSLCLLRKTQDGRLKPVALEFVKGLPNHVVAALFAEAKTMSRLDVGADPIPAEPS